MMMQKILLSTAAIAVIAGSAYAATTTIEATATFVAGITLGNEVDMDFSSVSYTAAPSVAADVVSLGSDATITYGGVFAAGISASPVAGEVEITAGTTGQTVSVECDASAIMTDGTETLNVVSIEVTDTPAAFGGANACGGTGASAMTRVLTGTDVLYFGGEIDGSSASAGFPGTGSYSTANAGGDNIEVIVNYQ